MQLNWKMKYQELKLKFKETVDLSFRLGVEEGMRQGQVQQQQQADAAAQAAMGQPGQPGDPNAQPGQEMPGQEQSDGSELDQHIGKLESMLQKTEAGSAEHMEFKKSLDGIKSFQANLRQASELKKAEKAISAIGKAMKPAFTIGRAADKNMPEHSKKALTSQEQIVADIMKSFQEEETKAAQTITKALSFEQLLKE